MNEQNLFCNLQNYNHQPKLLYNLERLLTNEIFTDCMLVAEGKYIKAHKVILSMCSNYFYKLLKDQDSNETMIIVENITFKELEFFVNYSYTGKIKSTETDIINFMQILKFFEVNDLSNSSVVPPENLYDVDVIQQQQISPRNVQNNDNFVPNIYNNNGINEADNMATGIDNFYNTNDRLVNNNSNQDPSMRLNEKKFL